MTAPSPMLALMPGTAPAPGTGVNTGTDTGHDPASTAASALRRAGDGYFDWLDHIWPAAGCAHPVRLHGTIRAVDPVTGEILRTSSTEDMPDRVIYKACGNRRIAACPSCAETYRRDAYHVIRAGLAGGKGISEHVASHPAVFATFTAPSFGPVHGRVITHHLCESRERCRCRPEPCHARHDAHTCPHGRLIACYRRHNAGDKVIGQPICPDCYDYAAAAVWNNAAGELWRRTKQAIERHLNHRALLRNLPKVRVSHGKAAEFQARGAVHFHVLLRLDGIDPADPDALIPPPPGITVADLDDAIRQAAAAIAWTTPAHPRQPAGWRITWGPQLDVRIITMRGANPVTDAMVAAYLAKYSTKGTEATGHASARLDDDTIDLYANPDGTHTERLIDACWSLGREPAYRSLRRWAHMLGFGGHLLTKGRRYSITFRVLRQARVLYRRTETTGPEHEHIGIDGSRDLPTTLIVGNLTYGGTGWKTSGDALLANTAADLARRRRQIGREEINHESAQVEMPWTEAA
ncbi:MAG: replication initiator [Streptosporangiaceae bacterium]